MCVHVGIALHADSEPLTIHERVEAVNQVLRFSEGRMSDAELRTLYEKEEQLKSAIMFARAYLEGTQISQRQIGYLCEEAQRGGCRGHRAEIAAARVALASAALDGKSALIQLLFSSPLSSPKRWDFCCAFFICTDASCSPLTMSRRPCTC
jgi:Mg-chelatase subunit ChlI